MSVHALPPAGSAWGRVTAVYLRHARELLNSVPAWFDFLFWPLVDLVIWGTLTVFIERGDAGLPVAVGYLIGGVLLWDIVFRSNLGIGVAFLEDTSWSHNMLNFLVSPLRPGEYLLAIGSWAFTKVAVGWLTMAVTAGLLFAFTPFKLGLALVLFMLALMIFGLSLALVVVGVILRLGTGADVLAWGLAMLLMPVSAVFYPVSVLPGWAQAIASALPTAHIFESMRTVLGGDPIPWSRLALAFALDGFYLALAGAWCARMFATLRTRGFVTRYMT